jgi:hypothetical protein
VLERAAAYSQAATAGSRIAPLPGLSVSSFESSFEDLVAEGLAAPLDGWEP